MRALLPLAVALVALAPTAAACDGLSPGDELLVGDTRCTLAFLLAGPEGLYFATAGHCIGEGDRASSPDAGEWGTAVFSHDEDGPGVDFALVRVDDDKLEGLNPRVCAVGGPTGVYRETPGGGNVRHHGYGLVFGDVGPATRERTGTNLWTDLRSFTFVGAGVPGDSGSAVVSEDGLALGVLTHVGIFPSTVATNGGTHLDQGLALAEEKGLSGLRLVLEGEDPLAALAQARAPAPPSAAEEPAPPSPQPDANETAPTPANQTPDEEGVVPAATGDDAPAEAPARTPGAPLWLVLLAVGALARRRTRRA